MNVFRYPDYLAGAKEHLVNKYLWGFYALIVLLISALLLFSIFYARNLLRESAFAQAQVLTLALNEINLRQMDSMSMNLEFLLTQIESQGGIEKLSAQELDVNFKKVQALFPEGIIRSIYYADKDGRLRYSTITPSNLPIFASPLGFLDLDYIKTETSGLTLNVGVSPIGNIPIVTLNKRIYSKDGVFTGVLGVTRAVADFESFYKKLNMPSGMSFSIFRTDGKLLYRYPDNDKYQGKKFAIDTVLLGRDEAKVEGTSIVDGLDKIAFFKVSENYGILTYVGYNKEAIFAGWRVVSILLFSILLVFVGAMMFLAQMVRKRQNYLRKTLEENAALDELIRKIQDKTEALTGQDFLRELCFQISKVFDVRNVAIGVLLPEHTHSVKFIVNLVDGALATDFIYDLTNTPFEKLKPGEFFAYPKSVSKIFTQDPMLSYRNVESSMGLVLQDSEQMAIGILMIYSEKEMLDLSMKRTVLSVFAARAGAELERIHTDEIRREVERLRRQIEERSLQSEKMEAIGTLAEGITHDFNNILAIILATTDKLLSLHKDPKDQQYLEAIRRAGQRARHLVTQIQIFSRKEEPYVQPIQIKKIFMEVIDFLRSTLPAQIRLTLDLADCGDLIINADFNQIQQALLNLCVNASRAVGPNGGDIHLSVRESLVQGRPYVKWTLHYSGEEMNQDEIENVFDPFYAQNIGMVVAQRIISNHQGFVEVKSGSGHGTDVEIFFPVVGEESGVEMPMTAFNFKSAKKVLIVDDEPEIGQLIKELLESEGLQVDSFTDPVLALKTYTELQSQYFMIITDLSMPGMSGVELIRKVREMNQQIPMILWSGYNQYVDEEILKLNVKVLSKPVDVQKLLSLINADLSQLSSLDIAKGVL